MPGEDPHFVGTLAFPKGSPPHARGRLGSGPGRSRRRRITPACAGKTQPPSDSPAPRRDHPRVRGENNWAAWVAGQIPGSPPHARGRPAMSLIAGHQSWITPACAGKTSGMIERKVKWTDHPRMRGEDFHLVKFGIYPLGSPPHARGRRDVQVLFCDVPGITPACAGKTDNLSGRPWP